MDATIQCPSSRGCGVWRMLGEGGVELFLCGHIHYYARDLPEWPVGNNGTGDVDTTASSPNLGNASNPIAVYTNPKFMTTIVTAAPGDQEVNRRRAEEAPAVGAGQHSITSSNNYGVSVTPFARSRVRPCTNTRRAPTTLSMASSRSATRRRCTGASRPPCRT